MRLIRFTSPLLCLLLALCLAQAAYAVTEFGKNPYYQPPLQSVADLHKMVSDNPADIKTGLEKAGYPDLYEPLMAQLPEADIQPVEYYKGQEFKWMFYRKNGKGPVRVDKVLVWESDTRSPVMNSSSIMRVSAIPSPSPGLRKPGVKRCLRHPAASPGQGRA